LFIVANGDVFGHLLCGAGLITKGRFRIYFD
jgi:hypothetical protein